MERFLTAKELMNYYGKAGIEADILAHALEANYGDCNQIMRFIQVADKCHALNQLYSTAFTGIVKRNEKD